MSATKTGRRRWMVGGAALATAAALPVGRWLVDGDARSASSSRTRLMRDPILELREGFSYRTIERVGARMSDGRTVPPRPDGMACFAGPDDGTLILMRNHELPAGWASRLVGGDIPAQAYDPEGPGGVTRVVLDARTLTRRSSNQVLAGTSMNCSGGASPWGWLSCEEDSDSPRHGWVFLCDPLAGEVAPPALIRGYGRFRHEAAAIDPATSIAYLSEDRGDSALYRFVPRDPAQPFQGRLQALAIDGRPDEDTSPLLAGERRDFVWIDLPRADPAQDDLRHIAHRLGAASFKRGEGVCFADGLVHLCASTGGPIEGGQIFRLADQGDGGTLEVIASSTDRGVLDMPDNITVAPNGMPFFVEDGEGHDFIRAVAPSGDVVDLGRNAAGDGEIAGVCFTPDGRAMFVNLQEEGLTLCIEGPFAELASL